MNPIARSIDSLHRRGLRRSLQSALSIVEDWWFDRRYGTDTMARLSQAELVDLNQPNKASAHAYIPTRGRAFRRVLASLCFPPGSVFVDYGSGKGKVLLLAATFDFRRIVGIEYAPMLHEIAVANIKRFPSTRAERIEPVCADATSYELRDDENIFYFFNPFELDVLEKVIARIRASLARIPRHIWVIYFDPRFGGTLVSGLSLRQTNTFVYGGYEVVVLENDFGHASA